MDNDKLGIDADRLIAILSEMKDTCRLIGDIDTERQRVEKEAADKFKILRNRYDELNQELFKVARPLNTDRSAVCPTQKRLVIAHQRGYNSVA